MVPPDNTSARTDLTTGCAEALLNTSDSTRRWGLKNRRETGSLHGSMPCTTSSTQWTIESRPRARVVTAEQWPEARVSSAGQSPGLSPSPSVTGPYRHSDCFDAYSLDCVTRNQTKKMTSDSNNVANAIESILLLVCVLIRSFLFDVHARDKTGRCGT